MMQIEGLKYILEHSGSSRLRNLTKRVLSEEYYDVNKIQNKFISQAEEENINQREVRNRNNSRRYTNNNKPIQEDSEENKNNINSSNDRDKLNRTQESINSIVNTPITNKKKASILKDDQNI
jgi:predicted nucleotidyltransferase component of viral defense system